MQDENLYDDDDYLPAMSGEADPTPPVVATPESRNTNTTPRDYDDEDPLEAAEAAAAAAEVAAMEGGQNEGGNRRGRDPTADRALMGAHDAADGGDNVVAAHEVLDESGELVRGAFLEFLQN